MKKLISIELSEELIQKIKEVAKEKELSMSALIRLILKIYLDKNEK